MNSYKVTLSQQERDYLMSITRSGTHTAKKVIHSLILLNADRGEYCPTLQTNEEVSKILKIGMRTIDRVKKRFVEEGLRITVNLLHVWKMF